MFASVAAAKLLLLVKIWVVAVLIGIPVKGVTSATKIKEPVQIEQPQQEKQDGTHSDTAA